MKDLLYFTLVPTTYLTSVVLFILGLKRLRSVRSARGGNALTATAMVLAVLGTLVEVGFTDYSLILAGLVIGSAVGAIAATTVPMTDMPQMVALLNGFGGGASALVALSNFWSKIVEPMKLGPLSSVIGLEQSFITLLSIIIGAATLSGSMVAYLKLQEWISSRSMLLPGRHTINSMLLLGTLSIGIWFALFAKSPDFAALLCLALLAASVALGLSVVIPIGGADMPVVISLLNSFSGIAASATGFILGNPLLITVGALVGASGLILTRIMCVAMNRSLANVLFGAFGSLAETTIDPQMGEHGREYKSVRSCSAEETAIVLEYAQSVVIVPGYGLAVAQAQHMLHELAEIIQKRGAKVCYAIHPVAGRMPGHMNVLLAEANVPYEELTEMEQINPAFKNTDVVLVVGANDVVNPAAQKLQDSPIYGMPILEVYNARSVFVIKRSLSPGFAGIKNELFEYNNTMMLFGDAKEVLQNLIAELKSQAAAA